MLSMLAKFFPTNFNLSIEIGEQLPPSYPLRTNMWPYNYHKFDANEIL